MWMPWSAHTRPMLPASCACRRPLEAINPWRRWQSGWLYLRSRPRQSVTVAPAASRMACGAQVSHSLRPMEAWNQQSARPSATRPPLRPALPMRVRSANPMSSRQDLHQRGQVAARYRRPHGGRFVPAANPCRNRATVPVDPGARARDSEIHQARSRLQHDAQGWLPCDCQAHHDHEFGQAGHEFLRAVKRVDDPDPVLGQSVGGVQLLFRKDPVVRKCAPETGGEEGVALPVGHGHGFVDALVLHGRALRKVPGHDVAGSPEHVENRVGFAAQRGPLRHGIGNRHGWQDRVDRIR